MSSVVEETVDRVQSATPQDFVNRASDVVELLADQISGAVKSADGYIRANPWAAVGAVALAAIAVGVLFSRRPRRQRYDDVVSEVSGG